MSSFQRDMIFDELNLYHLCCGTGLICQQTVSGSLTPYSFQSYSNASSIACHDINPFVHCMSSKLVLGYDLAMTLKMEPKISAIVIRKQKQQK